MSDAELVIRLLGDATPEEQAAIAQPMQPSVDPRDNRPPDNREPENRDGSSRPMGATSAPANPQRTFDPSAPSPKSEAEPPSVAQVIENIRAAFRDGSMGSRENSFEVSVAKFGQYVESLLAARPAPTQESQTSSARGSDSSPSKNTWLSRLENRSPLVKRITNRFRQGRRSVSMLSSAARKWGSAPGRTRIGKAARSVVSRVLGAPATKAATTAGTTAATTATGNAGAAAGGGAGAAAGAGTTAAIGLTVGATVAALAAVGVAAGALVKAFNDAADDIERLSPDVALARARTRMNTELNMLDRAQRIGPASGRLEAAKGALGNQVEKLLTDILAVVAKFEPQITAGVNFAEAGVITLRGVISAIDRIIGTIESIQALTTVNNQQDDAAAAARIKAADQNITDRFNDLAKKLKEAADNLAGVQKQQQPGIDPLLLQIFQGGP